MAQPASPLRFTYETFDLPGAKETLLADLDTNGRLVGRYKDADGLSHGFFQDGTNVLKFNVTGKTATFATGFDKTGRIVGFYRDAANPDVQHGFLRETSGAFVTIDSPGKTTTTYLWRLNDAGQINGYHFEDEPFFIRSFRRAADGSFTTNLVFPGSPLGTVTRGMNEVGTLTGWKWTDAFALQGVIVEGTNFTSVFTVPGWANTLPGDINNRGEIAGTVINGDFGDRRGFFRTSDGRTSVFTPPGATETEVFGLNDAGLIVGEYVDQAGQRHSFIASPATGLDKGHTDIGIAFENGEWDLHIHSEATDTEYAPDEAVLQFGAASEQYISDALDFRFLGDAGRATWILPQVENENLLFLGLAAEEIKDGVFVNNTLRVELVSVDGPGSFFVWTLDPLGKPQIHFNSADGILSSQDFYLLKTGGHQDMNWAFSASGTYRVGYRVSGTLVAGNQFTQSGVAYYTFEVPEAKLPQPVEPDDTLVYKVALLELEGANYVVGEEVNESGMVAVGAYDENDKPVAARFTDELTLLAPLTPRGAYASSINDAGLTVGWALNDAGLRRAVAWSNGIPSDLGTLGGDRGEARGVNHAGQIVGQARNAAGEARAFLWKESSGMSELPMTLGGNRSAASAINANGVVAGSGRLPDGRTHAVRHDPGTGTTLDLGTLGGDDSFANGINDAGQVAGLSDDSEGGFRPFFWSPETGMVDLFADGHLGSPSGAAYDINNSGQVVGYGEINDDYDSHAFVWTRSEGLKNLNDWVVRMPGLELYGASGINNAGQITGWGALNGARIGYRLDPATRLKRGEVDLGLAWEDGELEFHAHDHAADIEYAADAVVLHVPALAQTAVPANPAFAFLGAAGSKAWILPLIENPKLLFLGLAAEEIEGGLFVNDEIKLTLTAVSGPGHFALYTVDGFGQPQVRMNTRDGVDLNDAVIVVAGSHGHYNWAFSAPGCYQVRVKASGTLVAGSQFVESEEVEFFFEVIPIETQLAITRSGGNATISFVTQDGLTYQLEAAPAVTGPWTDKGAAFLGTGRPKQITVPLSPGTAFFRMKAGAGN